MLTSNKLATHQLESQHAQQAQQQQAVRSNLGLIRSAVAQHAQHAADEALSQEAAAAEEALGSFSRPSSGNALYSGHTPTSLLAQAPTDASAQAAAATQSSACHLELASHQDRSNWSEASQQMVMQSAAVQHPPGQTNMGARGLHLTAPEGQQLTQAQVSLHV